MTKLLVALTLAIAATLPAKAGDPWIMGQGVLTCGAWLYGNEPTKSAGAFWVLGYWSGANVVRGSAVGEGIKNSDILGAVAALCKSEPTLTLSRASGRAYLAADNMRTNERFSFR